VYDRLRGVSAGRKAPAALPAFFEVFIMMFLLVLFLALFIFFFVLSSIYTNPYRLIFVFGKKGAGKSCYMVRQMLRYKRKGWNVYTDMADVRIPGVRIISVSDLATFRPEEHSLVCLDEVGITMDNRSFKTFPSGLRDFFKYVRKMKCVVIINSQAYDVDKKVRDTVDSMLLMQSIGAVFTICRPIQRSITLVEPSADSEGRIADRLSFTSVFSWRVYFLPAYFGYFDSTAMPPREVVPVLEAPCADPVYSQSPAIVYGRHLISRGCYYVRRVRSLCARLVALYLR